MLPDTVALKTNDSFVISCYDRKGKGGPCAKLPGNFRCRAFSVSGKHPFRYREGQYKKDTLVHVQGQGSRHIGPPSCASGIVT